MVLLVVKVVKVSLSDPLESVWDISAEVTSNVKLLNITEIDANIADYRNVYPWEWGVIVCIHTFNFPKK